MALRLRRGLDIERQSITFAEGEPLYTTDTKQLYVGDGSTVGGNLVTGITSLLDDPTPQLGNNLDLNNHNITGVGNIDIVGDLTIKGGLNADFILADYRGSLFGNDSSLLVDGNNGVITASVVSGSITLVDVDDLAINLNYTSIDSLSDVAAHNPMPGDTLIYQNGFWEAARFGVDPITNTLPLDYSLLQFSYSGGWVGTTKISASDSTLIIDLESGEINLGSSSIKTFSDVWIDEVALEPNEVLTWDGDFWTHKQIDVSHISLTSIVFDNISDVNVPAPSLDEFLKYDGTQWINDSVNMSNLSDVWIDPSISLKQDQILSWDGFHWTPTNNSLEALVDTYIEPNPVPGSVLSWDGFHWVGIPSTDIITTPSPSRDHVYAADSSIIINIDNQRIMAHRVVAQEMGVQASDLSNAIFRLINEDNTLSFADKYTNASTESDVFKKHGEKLGLIRFESLSVKDTPEKHSTGYIQAFTGALTLCHSLENFGSDPTEYVTLSHGTLHIGGFTTASEKLEVEGNAKVNGFVQFGSFTTAERDALTATTGMVIYNSTDDKFQGYASSTWVNLH